MKSDGSTGRRVRGRCASPAKSGCGSPPSKSPRREAGLRLVKERLERFFPECLEEVRGIADGSLQSLDRVLLLNCSDAVIGRASGGPSCSCIGFVDSDHGPLIGKTADWQVDHAQDLTTWQHYRPWPGEGYRFIHYGGAGTWWSEGGLNEAGLGMVLNGLPGEGRGPGQRAHAPPRAWRAAALRFGRGVDRVAGPLRRHVPGIQSHARGPERRPRVRGSGARRPGGRAPRGRTGSFTPTTACSRRPKT